MQAFSFLIGCLLFQYTFLLLEVVDSAYQLNLFNNIYIYIYINNKFECLSAISLKHVVDINSLL